MHLPGVQDAVGNTDANHEALQGAAFPALMGWVSDLTSIRVAFGLPLLCYVYIWYFAAKGSDPENVPLAKAA